MFDANQRRRVFVHRSRGTDDCDHRDMTLLPDDDDGT